MTKNLETILSEASAITSRREAVQTRIAAISTEKDEVIAHASGPDDAVALKKLNLLISQEMMADNQLTFCNREEEGSKVRLINEANYVRKAAIDALQKEQDRLIGRLNGKLEEFYPVTNELKKVVEHLHSGTGVLQIPALHEIRRLLAGLQGQTFNRREQTELVWATNICNSANRAMAFIETNKTR